MDRANTASISVSNTTAERIRMKIVEAGFNSEDDVVMAGLRALDQADEDRADNLAWVKARIKAAVEDTRPGYTTEEIAEHLNELFESAQKRS